MPDSRVNPVGPDGVALRVLEMLWHAMQLRLPSSRVSDGTRFFENRLPTQSARLGLLRSFARTFIEANYVGVRKDARHDPVELIAAALDLAIQQWNGVLQDPDDDRRLCATDLAIRVVAFERLFGVPKNDCAPWAAVEHTLADWTDGASSRYSAVWRAARASARINLAPHLAAPALAETVVLGCAATGLTPTMSPFLGSIDANRIAVPYALGIVLVSRGEFSAALETFEALLARAPADVLVLEQAARCCRELSDLGRATAYLRRSARGGNLRRSRAGATGKRAQPR